jgi:pyruvate dehydrogenase E1 component
MNENYAHPALPAGAAEGILKGMYLLRSGATGKVRATLFGSGTILREVLAAADLLEKDYGVAADVFSVTSFSELRRNALATERWNLLHAGEKPRRSYVQEVLGDRTGPFIASTDYMKTVADQIRQWVPGRYAVLGTDGFGRSDSRAELRRFFEVDSQYVALATLKALADDGKVDAKVVSQAMQTFGIDPEKPNPLTV